MIVGTPRSSTRSNLLHPPTLMCGLFVLFSNVLVFVVVHPPEQYACNSPIRYRLFPVWKLIHYVTLTLLPTRYSLSYFPSFLYAGVVNIISRRPLPRNRQEQKTKRLTLDFRRLCATNNLLSTLFVCSRCESLKSELAALSKVAERGEATCAKLEKMREDLNVRKINTPVRACARPLSLGRISP